MVRRPPFSGVIWVFPAVIMWFVSGCGYHREMLGRLWPVPEVKQEVGIQAGDDMRVRDDGTVTFVRDRLEISVRPMTDEQLNRQFAVQSTAGKESTNPYTFGDWKDWESEQTPTRFTVFLIKVKNYSYPKMRLDSSKSLIIADNGRRYLPLTLFELEWYYRRYVTGYAGNAYARYQERKDILRQTLYANDFVFSGQERSGYVVFPKLHDDVKEITLWIKEVVLRFDFLGEPTETLDVKFIFRRDHKEGV